MPKLKLPALTEAKPATVGLFLLTCLWAVFQWRDPTPPPVLDQILVASFGIWFANEAIDRKTKDTPNRTVSVDKDGNVTVKEQPTADTDADDDSTKEGG